MCDNTASTHFSNVASTYAAIYHQLYYNMNEGQIPGSITGNHPGAHPSHPHSVSGAVHGHPSNEHVHVLPPGPPGPYNHLQQPTSEPLNFQHHPVSFNNIVNVNNQSAGIASATTTQAGNVIIAHTHGMDRALQLPPKKQQAQHIIQVHPSEAGKFVYADTAALQNESSHTGSTGSFDNEEPIPMFLNSPNTAMNMKRRPCEKDEYRVDLNRIQLKGENILTDGVSALRNYEEWLGSNKPADMSTKTMLPNSTANHIATAIIPTINNPVALPPPVMSVVPVHSQGAFILDGGPETKKQKKLKKTLKQKKEQIEQVIEPPKIKYVPAGQANVSRIKANKYDRLYEIKESFYKSCHVCFNDPHLDIVGCPLMTPISLVENHENHPHGFGMPEQLLLGLSRTYKDEDSIFARDHIPAYIRFGPIKGRKIYLHELSKIALVDIDLKHFWPVNASEDDELDLESFIDTSQLKDSNWMRFLKPEVPAKDQPSMYNIQRVTLDEEIYFITTRGIQPGEELLYRAIEPPFRVYYNLEHLQKGSAICQLYPCKKKKEQPTLDLENLVYYVRHAYLNHPGRPGMFKVASIYNCNICKDDFFDAVNYTNHMKEKHGEIKQEPPSFTCYFCKKMFSSKSVLKKHMKGEHPATESGESMDCPVCGKNFLDKYKLRWHMKTIHLSEPVPCKVCGKSFKSKPVMENHVKKVHEQKYWKECGLCGKGFKDLYQLRQHMLTHTGAKPFCCIIKGCPAQFTTKQWLQKHYIGGHGFTMENMPTIRRREPIQPTDPPPPLPLFKPRPKKKATYVPPAKPGTSLRIPDDFNLVTALRPLGKPPPSTAGKNNKLSPKGRGINNQTTNHKIMQDSKNTQEDSKNLVYPVNKLEPGLMTEIARVKHDLNNLEQHSEGLQTELQTNMDATNAATTITPTIETTTTSIVQHHQEMLPQVTLGQETML